MSLATLIGSLVALGDAASYHRLVAALLQRLGYWWRALLTNLLLGSWDLERLLLVQVLRHQHWLDALLALTPVDCRLRAHVTTDDFFVNWLQQLRQVAVRDLLGAEHHEVLIVRSAFNVSQQLIVPLDLVNHLAMDVFNVEVLSGHH